jgi:hypothetical protein
VPGAGESKRAPGSTASLDLGAECALDGFLVLSDCRAWSRDAAAIGGHAKYAPVLEVKNRVGVEAWDMCDQRAVTLGKRSDGRFLRLGVRRECRTVSLEIRGSHWTASARAYHWKAARAAAGWEGSLYLATRHFAGWYMVNVLELPSEDVAIALGHTDGGELVT